MTKKVISYIVVLIVGISIGIGYSILIEEPINEGAIVELPKDKEQPVSAAQQELDRYQQYFKSSLGSLNSFMAPALPGEWLSVHDEPGQTFNQYQEVSPVGKSDNRFKLYIQPIGDFSQTEKAIVILTADYLGRFYNIHVEILDSISTNLIPDSLHRINLDYHQINAKYILYNVLKPQLPDDAVAYIAFTNLDLYPSPDMNFVFGLGSLKNRVGVYSLARFGNPSESKESYQKCLLRTLKVASHELGHMFSVKHCVEYDCLMNGSNSMEESDSKPFHLCPIDLMKVCWNLEVDEIYRFEELAEFWEQNGFPENADFCNKSIELLKKDEFRK